MSAALTAEAGDTLDFELPEELVATEPPEARGVARDAVRLLVSDPRAGRLTHTVTRDLPGFLEPGDLLVVNVSATLPAAVPVGDRVVHLSTPLPSGLWLVEVRRRAGEGSLPLDRPVREEEGEEERIELPGGAAVRLLSPYPAGITQGIDRNGATAGASAGASASASAGAPAGAPAAGGTTGSGSAGVTARLWVAAFELPDDRGSKEQPSREQLSRDQLKGDRLHGEQLSRDQLMRDRLHGDQLPGNGFAGGQFSWGRVPGGGPGVGAAGVHAWLGRYGRPVRYGAGARAWPLSAYQTPYATEPGSAEMPSAGRALTPELLTALMTRGVGVTPLVLHTGVSSQETGEPPYPEPFRVPAETAARVNAAHAAGRRVVAVGTTVTRALETVAEPDGTVHPGRGWTDLVITPARGVRAVDGILTGWHDPRASHLDLLEAVASPPAPVGGGASADHTAATGREHLARCYSAALAEGYRWHEFGDLLLLLR